MAYIKLSKETNTGKGFISPGNRKTLKNEIIETQNKLADLRIIEETLEAV